MKPQPLSPLETLVDLNNLQGHTSDNLEDTTAIIIPCYNEGRRLALDIFLNFVRNEKNIHLIFVDDGSRDYTLSLLCGAAVAVPQKVRTLMMKKNVGKSEAVRQGMKYATRQGYKYVAFLDADLATPLYAIQDFAAVADRMDEIDVVFGSRCGGLGNRVYREFHRKIISFVCATMGRFATGLPIKDTQCGAKLFRNTPALIKCLEQPFSAGWLFDVELFLRVSNPEKNKRNNFFEYPVLEWTEIPGSKIKSSDVLRSGVRMIELIVRQWQIRRDFYSRGQDKLNHNVQTIRCGELLSTHHLKDITEYLNDTANEVILDLCDVRRTSPSVFTSLMEYVETIHAQGHSVKVRLPDDEEILNEAIFSGLTSVTNCTLAPKKPDMKMFGEHFDFIEA